MSEPHDKNGSFSESPKEDSSPMNEPGDAASASPADPIAEAKAEAQRFKDQWMRSAADFDNFRKRSRKELEDTRKAGREELLKDLLPVFDNLERAMTSAERATEVKPVSDGLKLVLRQFTDTLGRSGITKVPTVGQPFDPSMHEAIQQVETDEVAPGTVMAEVQPGYLQGDRLVRAAMVVVAKPKGEDAAAESDA
jgi:molecular chaperone GrpE